MRIGDASVGTFQLIDGVIPVSGSIRVHRFLLEPNAIWASFAGHADMKKKAIIASPRLHFA